MMAGRGGNDCYLARVQCTVKTHKEPGDVGMHIIHSASKSRMMPGMRFIANELKKTICHLPHLLRDTDHLLQKVRCLRFPSDHRLLKIDIKDYCMSGNYNELPKSCASTVAIQHQSAFRELLNTVLRNQFVETMNSSGVKEVFRVLVGSGIGLLCSGEVSDVCFYVSAEKNFVLLPAIRAKYEISFYARFKDDTIISLGARGNDFCTILLIRFEPERTLSL